MAASMGAVLMCAGSGKRSAKAQPNNDSPAMGGAQIQPDINPLGDFEIEKGVARHYLSS